MKSDFRKKTEAMAAWGYIERIKNLRKRAFAIEYYQWRATEAPTAAPLPPRELSTYSADAVRRRIDWITFNRETR